MEESIGQDDGEKRICSECIGDVSYREHISSDGIIAPCDFNESHGQMNKTLKVREFAELVDTEFRSNYGPGSDIPEVSEDSDKIWYSQGGSPYREIMQENIQCSEEIIDAIDNFLPDASPRDIQKGADTFYDDTMNYSLLREIDDFDSVENDQIAEDNLSRSPDEVRAQLESRIEELQREILEIKSSTAGLGHNHPPEPIFENNSLDKDLQNLDSSLAILKQVPSIPTDKDERLLSLEKKRIDAIYISWINKTKELGKDAFGSFAKESGKIAARYAYEHGLIGDVMHYLLPKIQAISELIGELISSLFT